MKILVTGTAGFIGFHLAKSLLADGHEVIGIDNFNSYYPVILKRARHAILEEHPGYRGIEADLADTDRIMDLMKQEKFELVCNLAAQAGVRHSLTHPFDYTRSNITGFLSILEACRHTGVQRLVYASSSSVYGNNTKLPFSESDPVDHPISLYAASKKANELMAHTYTHLYGFQTIGLRFFTVYGPWGRPDMAMWIFADKVSRGEAIPVFNLGKMQRDFTYIDDIIDGIRKSLFTSGLEPFEIFNLGNHRSENLADMIATLADNLGVQPQIEYLPMQPGDVPATYADIEKAQTKLGFEPRTKIGEGIARFTQWFREHQDLVQAISLELRNR